MGCFRERPWIRAGIRGLWPVRGPGWIEVEFVDGSGRPWLVHDKPPIFAEPPAGFLAITSYPAPTLIPCDVLGRETSDDGRELVTVVLRDTETTTGRVLLPAGVFGRDLRLSYYRAAAVVLIEVAVLTWLIVRQLGG
jgi:hypothetical protein